MKTLFHNMNERIQPPADLKQNVFDKLDTPQKPIRLRPLAAVAALAVAVLLATPAMAAYIPPIEELMYRIAPEIAARFSPIQEVCEKNGIRMEVISTSIHGATAEIYLGFQDVSGQDRLAGGDSWPSYQLVSPQLTVKTGVDGYARGGGVEMSQYDENLDQYTSLIRGTYSLYSQEEGRNLTVREMFGDKLTLVVDFLNHLEDLPEVEVPITLGEAETITVLAPRDYQSAQENLPSGWDSFGYGGTEGSWEGQTEFTLLMPGQPVENLGRGLDVTAMVWKDGAFHLQVRTRQGADVQPLYHVCLVTSQGERIYSSRHLSFTDTEGADQGEYQEIIFDISQEDLRDCHLLFELKENITIRGPWRVTFPLVESDYVGEGDDGILETTAPTLVSGTDSK